jgi:hypothetical protein
MGLLAEHFRWLWPCKNDFLKAMLHGDCNMGSLEYMEREERFYFQELGDFLARWGVRF